MNLFSILRPKAEIAYLRDDCSIRQALEKMRAHGYTALPIIDKEGRYVGSISEGDFLWDIVGHKNSELSALEKRPLKDIIRPGWMPAASIYVTKAELLEYALNQNYIPMVDGREIFMGIVTRRDIISWLAVPVSKEV